jgi:ABC-type bacteriocin/lantibiotic exporter with double-glycine peptidase domain
MVLSFFEHPISRQKIDQILEPTPFGTPGFRVLRLRAYGYEVEYTTAVSDRPLTEALADGIPPIVLLQTKNLSHWKQETPHAVVLVGMDAETVYMNDPAFSQAPQTAPRIEFMLAWSDFDMLYAIIQPGR